VRERHAIAMIRNQVIRETQFEVEIRTLVHKVPALQSPLIDERMIQTIKIVKAVIESW
jgi:hypothetical protein